MNKSIENVTVANHSVNHIVKGTLISIIFTLVVLFVFSVVLTYTNLSEQIIAPAVIIITAISILVGSSISTIKIKKNGIINGGIIGFIYILFLYLISSIVSSNFMVDTYSIIMIVAAIAAGMVGGIVGVNIK